MRHKGKRPRKSAMESALFIWSRSGWKPLPIGEGRLQNMWNQPTQERLAKIPRLYETENTALKEKFIYLHFFIAGCDWYIAEYDGDDLFWGYAILNDDHQNAEWGYISFRELKEIKINGWLEVDCELEEHWKVRKASEIERIRNV